MTTSTDFVDILYFSGYIRNWKSLCERLGIELTLGRKEREEEILKKAYAEWKLGMMEHLYGMFAVELRDREEKKIYVTVILTL